MGLELDDDVAFQARMVEEQVDEELVSGDLETKLAARSLSPQHLCAGGAGF
jgi:hypothetical protein